MCSGWLYSLLPSAGYIFGVIFDLPEVCNGVPGGPCENTSFSWRWYDTKPGYGFTVTYAMYEVDSLGCMVGDALGFLADQDPSEGWNTYPGFGNIGVDRVSITVRFNQAVHPWLLMDDPDSNEEVGCASPPDTTMSVNYGHIDYIDCPPHFLQSPLQYPINIIMDANFSCETTSTEPTSWGAVKRLFR